MRAVAVCIFFWIGSASGEKFSESLKKLSEPQLHALARIGSIMQKAHLPAPWMESKSMQSRRLSTTRQLPSACQTACPSAQPAVDALDTKFMADMMSDPSLLGQISQYQNNGNQNPSMQEMTQTIDLMKLVGKRMLKTAFNDMCVNKAAYKCVRTNSNICLIGDEEVNLLSPDPVALTKQYKNSLDCMCDVCTGAQDAIIGFSSSILSALSSVFLSLSGTGASTSEEALQKDLLKGMCPLAGVNQCFQANPSVCADAMSDAMGSSEGSTAGMSFSNMSALEAECTSHGVSIEVAATAAPVTTLITLTGLDFAKVDADATLKAAIIDKVINRIATSINYPTDKVTVTALSSGSVKASVSVEPVSGASSNALQTKMSTEKNAIASGVSADVKTIPTIDNGLKDGVTKDSISGTMDDPVVVANTQTSAAEPFANLGLICTVSGLLTQVMACI